MENVCSVRRKHRPTQSDKNMDGAVHRVRPRQQAEGVDAEGGGVKHIWRQSIMEPIPGSLWRAYFADNFKDVILKEMAILRRHEFKELLESL